MKTFNANTTASLSPNYAWNTSLEIISSKKRKTSLPEKISHAIVLFSFLILFPGFFFYHTLLGMGVIPAVFGGYFAIFALAFILPLLFAYLVPIAKRKSNFSNVDLYFFIFLAYFLTVVLINYGNGVDFKITQTHLLSIIYFIDVFIIFKHIDLENKNLKLATIVTLLAMSAIILYVSDNGSFYLDPTGDAQTSESVATYQGFSRSYLFTLVVAISFLRNLSGRLLVYAIALPSLYLNGARSEMVGLLLLIPVVETYYSRNKFIFIFLLVSIVAALVLNIQIIIDALPQNRMLELLDLSHSTSANLRKQLTEEAIRTITLNPILGDYGSYLPGRYSHNILSAWVDLGFFGFCYLLLLLFIPLGTLFFTGFFKRKKFSNFAFTLSFLCVALLLVFSSKTFDDMVIAAALGSFAKYISDRKRAKNEKRKERQSLANLNQAQI